MDIRKRIEDLRNERKWSIAAFAEASDVDENAIRNWYNEQRSFPSYQALEKIAAAFGMTLGQLFCEGNYAELTDELKQFVDAVQRIPQEERKEALSVLRHYAK